MSGRIDYRLSAPAQIATDLGARLAAIRLSGNISQEELASLAGVASRTLRRFEAGEGASLDTLIRLMQALGLEGHLRALLPDTDIQPVQRFEREGQPRRRAGKRRGQGKQKPWSWDEDQTP